MLLRPLLASNDALLYVLCFTSENVAVFEKADAIAESLFSFSPRTHVYVLRL
jgi:hypothetical protein